MSWLNDSTPSDFYLFKAEAIRIGDSDPAPLMTRIVGPAEDKATVAETKKELGDRQKLRLGFWSTLLNLSRDQSKLFSGVSAGPYSYISTGAGITGVSYQYWVRQHDAYIQLFIDRGAGTDKQNEAIFEYVSESREAVEAAFSGALTWDRMEGKQACKIVAPLDVGGWKDDPEDWPDTAQALVETMEQFHAAISPVLNGLDVKAIAPEPISGGASDLLADG